MKIKVLVPVALVALIVALGAMTGSAGAGCPPGQTDPAYCTPSAPEATTDPATNPTDTSCQFNGTVVPNGQPTTYRFEYGTSPNSLGFQTQPGNAGGDYTPHQVSTNVTGLTPGTTYSFRVVAVNDDGTDRGDILTCTTTGTAPPGGGGGGGSSGDDEPTVNTLAATNITSLSATLNGNVDPNGLPTTANFQYGTNTDYGLNTPNQTVPPGRAAGRVARTISADVTGLMPSTTYHFRVTATNSDGFEVGRDMVFTTLGAGVGVPGTPTATPTPDPGTTSRKRKRPRLTLRLRPKRDIAEPYRYRAVGKLIRPAGVGKKAGCQGRIRVTIKRRKLFITRKFTPVRSDCTYRKRFVVPRSKLANGGSGRFHGRARFMGNAPLKRVSAPTARTRYGPLDRGKPF